MKRVIVLVAHGTVEDLADLPDFLLKIRRGRPAPPELIAEMEARYRAVGGSPHFEETEQQAVALQKATGIEARTAMRLWHPSVTEVTADLGAEDTVLLVPLAPYSVSVYEDAARRELASRADQGPSLLCVEPWGQFEEVIEAQTRLIQDQLEGLPVDSTQTILTAHSLPQAIIDAGDRYAAEFEAAAHRIASALPTDTSVAYQSQGASAGKWLGPSLEESMRAAKSNGKTHVLVAPMGFLSEHIETLYDLDIEAKQQAEGLGLSFSRVATLRTDPGLVAALARAVRRLGTP